MPNSLKTKLSKLRYQGKITDEEYRELIDKLEGHDEAITAQIKWERDTAIEQLKQLGYGLGEKIEPCDDCLSREEIIDLVKELPNANPSYSHTCDVIDRADLLYLLERLESVKPQPKRGEWIRQDDKSKRRYSWLYCSECGAWIGDKTKFCSECGAEMEDSND